MKLGAIMNSSSYGLVSLRVCIHHFPNETAIPLQGILAWRDVWSILSWSKCCFRCSWLFIGSANRWDETISVLFQTMFSCFCSQIVDEKENVTVLAPGWHKCVAWPMCMNGLLLGMSLILYSGSLWSRASNATRPLHFCFVFFWWATYHVERLGVWRSKLAHRLFMKRRWADVHLNKVG